MTNDNQAAASYARHPAIIFKGNCSIRRDFLLLLSETFELFFRSTCAHSRCDGFPACAITGRLGSTYTSKINTYDLPVFSPRAAGLTWLHRKIEDKHRDDLQFCIDLSILLAGAMPNQANVVCYRFSPCSSLADSHYVALLFAESQVWHKHCCISFASFVFLIPLRIGAKIVC